MSWRLAHSLEDLRDEILERWPGTTIWSIGDQAHRARASDHNPNQAGVVTAIDVLGRDKAAWLWHHLLERKDPRTKYLIFNRRIVNSTVSPWQVRHYGGSNPHADHIHISVGRGPSGQSTGPYDERGSWGLLGEDSTEEDEMPTPEDLWNHRIPNFVTEADDDHEAWRILAWAHFDANTALGVTRDLAKMLAAVSKQLKEHTNEPATVEGVDVEEFAEAVVRKVGERLGG